MLDCGMGTIQTAELNTVLSSKKPVTPPRVRPFTVRRLIFWVHLSAGCLAGVVIFFLAITGSIMAYEKQVTAFAERGYRSTPSVPGAASMTIDALLSSTAEAKGKTPNAIVLHADPGAPVETIFGKTDRLLLDHYTGRVLGAGATRTRAFFATVNGLHRWFGVPPDKKSLAHSAQGCFDLALLFLIVTGVFLWCPRTWGWKEFKAGAFLRPQLRGRARDWNLHNVLGFWTAIPLTVIVITGAILSYSWATNLLYRMAGSTPDEYVASDASNKGEKHNSHEKKSLPASSSPAESGKGPADLDSIFATAENESPGWRSLSANLPRPSDRKITLAVDFGDGSRPDKKSELVFDRTTGDVVQRKIFSSNSLGKRLRLFVRNVHTGGAAGILGQTVITLAALGCCVLIWTGLRLFARRIIRLA
jgi:uncharacterized iron-regulated membrane protein